jgi:general stress protein CsbA
VTKANFGFVGVLVVLLAVCTYVPWLSLVLINVFYGS